jgi:hypothetical protein
MKVISSVQWNLPPTPGQAQDGRHPAALIARKHRDQGAIALPIDTEKSAPLQYGGSGSTATPLTQG